MSALEAAIIAALVGGPVLVVVACMCAMALEERGALVLCAAIVIYVGFVVLAAWGASLGEVQP